MSLINIRLKKSNKAILGNSGMLDSPSNCDKTQKTVLKLLIIWHMH